ncbi:hypothetical protein DC496_10125 [Bifidobacterium breve]|uniref:Ferredoxin n=1 Tax=Bifidobacterium breve TaxID=1685 RepID=A0AAW7LLV7_BIFBR|nr:hypothetical protein [Bifidobacterium breve]
MTCPPSPSAYQRPTATSLSNTTALSVWSQYCSHSASCGSCVIEIFSPANFGPAAHTSTAMVSPISSAESASTVVGACNRCGLRCSLCWV